VAAVGDTLAGAVSQNGDIDWFAIDIPAGREVKFSRVPGATASLDLALYDTDGKAILADKGSEGGGSQTITYPITTAGRYFYVVSGNQLSGSPSWTYAIAVTDAPLTLGRGDPAQTVTTLDGSVAAVATRSGDFFIASWYGAIQRVTTTGTKTNFAALPRDSRSEATGGLALDEFDNLLMPGRDSMSRSVVWSFSPQGSRSIFFVIPGDYQPPAAILVASDGDIWLGPAAGFRDSTTLRLWRISAQGVVKDTIDLTGLSGPRGAVFSPTGELHFSARGGVYKLVGRSAVQVIATQNVIHELAFDRDGYLYALAQPPKRDPTQPGDDRQFVKILLFDPQDHVVSDPFANVPSAATVMPSGALLFGRNADGTMAARLFTLQSFAPTKFVELNANGIRAPGAPVGKQSSSSQLVVVGGALHAGVVGTAYADTLKASGASGAVTWGISSGSLPPGITLAASGVLSGTPTDSGSFAFDARAAGGAQNATGHFTIAVSRQQPGSISIADIANALLGGPALTADQVQYLDAHGNHNGVLDVGDFRAYLRAQGQLVGSAHP
jgi:hypothetical protein